MKLTCVPMLVFSLSIRIRGRVVSPKTFSLTSEAAPTIEHVSALNFRLTPLATSLSRNLFLGD